MPLQSFGPDRPYQDAAASERLDEFRQLLHLQDEAFVRQAYRTLLGREADEPGLQNYLQQLRAGVDRLTLALDLAHSEESRQHDPVWSRLLPRDAREDGSRGLAWWRRRLLGVDPLGLLQAINRIDNQVYRLDQRLRAAASINTGAPVPQAATTPAQPMSVLIEAAAPGDAVPVTAALLALPGTEQPDRSWPAPMRRAVRLPRRARQSSEGSQPRPMKVLIDGQFSGTYSLAITNRELVRSLLRQGVDVDVAIQPREHEPTSVIKDLPGGDDDYDFYRRLLARGSEPSFTQSRYVRLYYSWPPVAHRRNPGEIAIAAFFWEESIIPDDIIQLFNDHYDGVLVCTWFVKKTLIDCGCRVPVELTPYPHELLGGNRPQEPARRGDRQGIEFLHVSSCFARKGVDALLRAFSQLALEIPNVRLTIKTFENPHLQVREQTARLVDARVRDRVRLRIEELSDRAMAELYRSADAVVLPTRGEGLNMPVIEAAYYRVPVISTAYTGQADFATAQNSFPVAFRFDRSRSHLERDGSLWCEPDHADLVRAMREVAISLMTEPQRVWARSDKLTVLMHETFLHPRATEGFQVALQRLTHAAALGWNQPPPLRLALVSSWMEPCGIAEYSSYLGNALVKQGVQVTVVAPEHERSLQGSVLPARKAGWRQSLYFRLEGRDFDDADAVWFQHHPGFFALSHDVRRLLRQLTARGVPAFITLHSTSELLLSPARMPEVIDCLREFERVVVHAEADRNVLLSCGLSENVVVIPHGVIAPEAPRTSGGASAPSGDQVTIGCFGFLLKHKGIDKLISMVAASRTTPGAPKLRLRLVNAVRADESSRQTLQHCLELAASLKVEDAIEWHTDYLPQDRVMSLLRGCDLLALPYQPTTESASGAVRLALAASADVLVSREPIFDEIRDCTWTVDAGDGERLWSDVQRFLQQRGGAEDQARRERLAAWLKPRSWDAVARNTHHLALACLADIRYSEYWDRAA